MTGIVESVVILVMNFILFSGYSGVFLLMLLESALIPIPSEVIMPFCGFLVAQQKLDLLSSVVAGTLGNVVGSIAAYAVGLYLGRGFILKYGRYILLKQRYLALTERWFKKYGDKAIFFSRMMPVVRTFVSLPAGIGKMDFKKFVLYTFFGSLPWVFLWTYIGVYLGSKWETIFQYTHLLDLAVLIGILVVALAYFIRRRRKAEGKITGAR